MRERKDHDVPKTHNNVNYFLDLHETMTGHTDAYCIKPFASECGENVTAHNKPFRKDRITPKAAMNIAKTFCARGLLLKVTIAVAVPISAVPKVQMRETFYACKVPSAISTSSI